MKDLCWEVQHKSPSHTLLNTWNQQVIETKLPFFCLSHVHMVKCSKSKPGSPTKPVSTNINRVQDNASKSPMMDREMNKPFTLVPSVPCNKELSAAFPHVTIVTSIFPVDCDNEAMHTFIVNQIVNMKCDAMKPCFMVTTKIQDGIHCFVENNCKRDATGKEFFHFLTSQHPNNCNIPITFAATCQQCLCSNSPSGHFI